jgi:hypothetical protein
MVAPWKGGIEADFLRIMSFPLLRALMEALIRPCQSCPYTPPCGPSPLTCFFPSLIRLSLERRGFEEKAGKYMGNRWKMGQKWQANALIRNLKKRGERGKI